MTFTEIAAMIRYYRKQSGLTQLALAKLAGIGKTAIFDIEKGKETIQVNTLLSVLNILNMRIEIIPPFPKIDGDKTHD